MYLKNSGHVRHVIKNLYEVWLPPVPDRNHIYGHELKKSDQKWRRMPLPQYYVERRPDEEARQKAEMALVELGELQAVTHFDPMLERYRREEWMRRLFGFWFMNNGEPVYLTGQHYMYLQWTKLDHDENNGYPLYYQSQLDRFYFRQLCWEDPFCHGYLIIGPRGFGKSSEESACLVETMTRPPHRSYAAIQSKTQDDAEEVVFQEKCLPIFNEYPDFFKPEYSHSTDTKKEFIFKRPGVRGVKRKKVKFSEDLELGNTVKTFSAKEKAVDGKTLRIIISDEIGKTDPKKEADVYKRNAIHAKAVYRNKIKRGLIQATSTIEEMDKGGDECYEIWKESDPKERDGNGYTTSKLYKYLVTALETQTDIADDYGNIPEEEARQIVLGERTPLLDQPAKLSGVMRKNPLHEGEAFIKDQNKCMFNVLVISTREGQLRAIKREPKFGRRGRLEWVNDKVDGDVEFIDDPNGMFVFWYMPDEVRPGGRKILNACTFEMRDDKNGDPKKWWMPCNTDLFRGGIDPTRAVRTDDPRASKFAFYGHRMYDHDQDGHKPGIEIHKGVWLFEDWVSRSLMFRYWGRNEDPDDDYENAIKAMRFTGMPVMPENNAGEFAKHLLSRGYYNFVIVKKHFDPTVIMSKNTKNSLGKDQPVSSNTEVIESYIKVIKQEVNRHGLRLPDLDLINQLRDFDPENPTKYDLVVAFGYMLLAIKAELEDFMSQKQYENIENIFNRYDISGNRSVAINQPDTDDDDSDDDDGQQVYSHTDSPSGMSRILGNM